MAKKPWRSWAKTYTQAWNLALNEPAANKTQVAATTGPAQSGNLGGGSGKYGDWRDDCCWHFNRNHCTKTNDSCKFDHCFTYCGKWGHGFHNCRKRLAKTGCQQSSYAKLSKDSGDKHEK